jgi:hypothetical protein
LEKEQKNSFGRLGILNIEDHKHVNENLVLFLHIIRKIILLIKNHDQRKLFGSASNITIKINYDR